MLLRKKAAEELKKEQERKAAERRRIIEERCGQPKNLDDANEGKFIRSKYIESTIILTLQFPRYPKGNNDAMFKAAYVSIL